MVKFVDPKDVDLREYKRPLKFPPIDMVIPTPKFAIIEDPILKSKIVVYEHDLPRVKRLLALERYRY